MQDANKLIKFVAEEPERNKEFLHVIGKRDCYACLNSLPATSVCETCKKGLIHSHMVHVWGEDGKEVTIYYFKCDNCGDISTRERRMGDNRRTKETCTIKGLVFLASVAAL